jgi:heat shock protein HtpX
MPLSGLGSTHPPIGERIAILRAMSQGAGLLSYQRAYSKIKGKPSMIIPSSGLKKDTDIAVRAPHPDTVDAKSGKAQARDVMDLMRAVNGYAFLVCTCGLKIKVPPDYQDTSIPCPRCKRENGIPKAAVSDINEAAAVVTAMVGALAVGKGDGGEVPMAKPIPGSAADPAQAPLEFHRRSDGWESFACACGHMLQISPAFTGSQMRCPKCDRITRIH